MKDKKLKFGSMQDKINHKMLEERNLSEVKANNTTQGLLDLISNLNDRVIKLTDTVEDLVKIVETNHKGLKLLTNITSANKIVLSHIEKVIKDTGRTKFKYKN